MKRHGYTITAYSGTNIQMENITNKDDVPSLLKKVVIDYCRKKEKVNPQENGVNVYISKSFNKDLPYKVLTFENTTHNEYAVTIGVTYEGNKSFCFYCDEDATENDIEVLKIIRANETKAVIIMYYTLASAFLLNCSFNDVKNVRDPIYNHSVFNGKCEDVDESGKLKQYILERDDKLSYYIGIENLYSSKLKLKLVLENLIVSFGPYNGQKETVFELNSRERKVFNVRVYGSGDISFKFVFAD